MAIYHCTIKIIGRGSGRSTTGTSAVGAAAYRSGTHLINEWNGVESDFTRKSGVVYSEICLPEHAPEAFRDRSTLWNSVEMAERRGNAQLAREIEAALPMELPLEEQIKLVQEYVKQFVDAGMCVDFSIHDKKIGNPHVHIMLTMRPLTEDGRWGLKSRMVYDLDDQGERIRLPSGKWKSHKEDLIDWNSKENAVKWRATWAELSNKYLEANGVQERIDHRSHKERGIITIPTVHVGAAAMAMERKGLETSRGNLNRAIQETNTIILEMMDHITGLLTWIAELIEMIQRMKTEQNRIPEDPGELHLDVVLRQYWEREQERMKKYSPRFQLKINSNRLLEIETKLADFKEKGVVTVNDFRGLFDREFHKMCETQSVVRDLSIQMKTAQERLEKADIYQKNLPVWEMAKEIKNQKRREQYLLEHQTELRQWKQANAYFHAKQIPVGDMSTRMQSWKREYQELKNQFETSNQKLKEIRKDVDGMYQVRGQVNLIIKELEKQKIGVLEREAPIL